MKTSISNLVGILVLLFTLHPATALAQGTSAFTYQGRLNDGGVPAGGSYDLRFTLYDAASGGNPVGGVLTNAATAVTNGLFLVRLDFGAGWRPQPRSTAPNWPARCRTPMAQH